MISTVPLSIVGGEKRVWTGSWGIARHVTLFNAKAALIVWISLLGAGLSYQVYVTTVQVITIEATDTTSRFAGNFVGSFFRSFVFGAGGGAVAGQSGVRAALQGFGANYLVGGLPALGW